MLSLGLIVNITAQFKNALKFIIYFYNLRAKIFQIRLVLGKMTLN
ncbi:hypothetical protein NEF87_001048 [Candidatus Lokiarchaeum ossiferum]|uniref:Uncharacterized protein n=1 Tax=Candidatus Lokiarchaeum ossiferum TaxID=2951803 RepID=A0ABY6HN80_9ARCH|nr:hypothetical protein NEF87_001048 [Candidatus Lokiarchaeum sp. B-35]